MDSYWLSLRFLLNMPIVAMLDSTTTQGYRPDLISKENARWGTEFGIRFVCVCVVASTSSAPCTSCSTTRASWCHPTATRYTPRFYFSLERMSVDVLRQSLVTTICIEIVRKYGNLISDCWMIGWLVGSRSRAKAYPLANGSDSNLVAEITFHLIYWLKFRCSTNCCTLPGFVWHSMKNESFWNLATTLLFEGCAYISLFME